MARPLELANEIRRTTRGKNSFIKSAREKVIIGMGSAVLGSAVALVGGDLLFEYGLRIVGSGSIVAGLGATGIGIHHAYSALSDAFTAGEINNYSNALQDELDEYPANAVQQGGQPDLYVVK